MFCPPTPSQGYCLWFGLETGNILFSYSDCVAMELITSTMILPELTPGQGLRTVAPCTLSISGHWAGPVNNENHFFNIFLHHY
jgi:hypothetical protein